jgi:hypothetical protein
LGKISGFTEPGGSRIPIPGYPPFELRFDIPGDFLALILENAAPLFRDIPVNLTVGVSGAIFLKREMTPLIACVLRVPSDEPL